MKEVVGGLPSQTMTRESAGGGVGAGEGNAVAAQNGDAANGGGCHGVVPESKKNKWKSVYERGLYQ